MYIWISCFLSLILFFCKWCSTFYAGYRVVHRSYLAVYKLLKYTLQISTDICRKRHEFFNDLSPDISVTSPMIRLSLSLSFFLPPTHLLSFCACSCFVIGSTYLMPTIGKKIWLSNGMTPLHFRYPMRYSFLSECCNQNQHFRATGFFASLCECCTILVYSNISFRIITNA